MNILKSVPIELFVFATIIYYCEVKVFIFFLPWSFDLFFKGYEYNSFFYGQYQLDNKYYYCKFAEE